jgi:transcriptional regulator with XRE-family HTH domain
MGRTDRRWSADELADRLGISRSTVHKIERGDPTVGLGLALEAATIVGVALYSDSDSRRALELARAEDRLTLLPQRVRRVIDVDDDF